MLSSADTYDPLMPEDYDSSAVLSTCYNCEGSGKGCDANCGIMAGSKSQNPTEGMLPCEAKYDYM